MGGNLSKMCWTVGANITKYVLDWNKGMDVENPLVPQLENPAVVQPRRTSQRQLGRVPKRYQDYEGGTPLRIRNNKKKSTRGSRQPPNSVKIIQKVECLVCKVKFTNNSHLRRHCRRFGHMIEPLQSQSQAVNTSGLQGRMLKKTKKTATHPCQICQKVFVSRNNLRRHLLSHSGDKRFRCVPCNRSFGRQDNFRLHLNTKSHEERALQVIPF